MRRADGLSHSHSRHQYVELVQDQTVGTWLALHRDAVQSFGGVPRKIVLDNLKAGIIKASVTDREAQRAAERRVEARPKPKDELVHRELSVTRPTRSTTSRMPETNTPIPMRRMTARLPLTAFFHGCMNRGCERT